MKYIHKHRAILATIVLTMFVWVSYNSARNLHSHVGSQGVFWHSHPLANGDNPVGQNHHHSDDCALIGFGLSFAEAITPSCIEVPMAQSSLINRSTRSINQKPSRNKILLLPSRAPPVAA